MKIGTFDKHGNPDYDPCEPLENGFCEKCRNCIEDKEKRCKETVDGKGQYVLCRKIGACVTYVPK